MALTRATIARWRQHAERLSPHIVSVGQIARRLNVPLNTVSTWTSGIRGNDPFPKTILVVGLPMGRTKSRGMALYLWPEVEAWAKANGRLPLPSESVDSMGKV